MEFGYFFFPAEKLFVIVLRAKGSLEKKKNKKLSV